MSKQQPENESVCVYKTSARYRQAQSAGPDFKLTREGVYHPFVLVVYETTICMDFPFELVLFM